jgi:hypothetical protein
LLGLSAYLSCRFRLNADRHTGPHTADTITRLTGGNPPDGTARRAVVQTLSDQSANYR